MVKSKSPKVSIVIPSWNSEAQFKTNLRYVYAAASVVNAEIVIVDDASSYDNSYKYLKKQGDKIRLYKNNSNEGFSYTVNKGVRLARGEIVILLNTDVRPSKNCFKNCLKLFKDDAIFAVTFNSGEAWMGGEWKRGLFHHFKVKPNAKNKDTYNNSLWASGGQAAFDKKKWNKLGGMDMLYKPFYWEDTDLGYTAWKRGWKVLWAPECKVVHDHQKSVIANNFSRKFIMDTAQRNQFLFVWKNIHSKKLITSHILHLPYYFIKYPMAILKALWKIRHVLKLRALERDMSTKNDQELLAIWER